MLRQIYRFDSETRVRLKKLAKLDNFHGPLAILEDYAIIGFAIIAFWFSPYFYPISIVLIGSRQRALATLLHESAHKTLSRNRILNYFLGTSLSGHLIFQLYQPYFRSHVLYHHRHLGEPGKDPDLEFHLKEGLYGQISLTQFTWRFLVRPWLFIDFPKHFIYIINARFRPGQVAGTKEYRLEIMSFATLWGAITIVVTLTGVWLEFLLLWIIPYLTTFQAVNWYCELSEHFPISSPDALDIHMTRNRFSTPLEKLFFGIHAENYHLEHHLNAGIPFWNLAAANAIRRSDKYYDEINAAMGGLIFSSNTGARSALSVILVHLRKKHIVSAQQENTRAH